MGQVPPAFGLCPQEPQRLWAKALRLPALETDLGLGRAPAPEMAPCPASQASPSIPANSQGAQGYAGSTLLPRMHPMGGDTSRPGLEHSEFWGSAACCSDHTFPVAGTRPPASCLAGGPGPRVACHGSRPSKPYCSCNPSDNLHATHRPCCHCQQQPSSWPPTTWAVASSPPSVLRKVLLGITLLFHS